MRKNWKWLVVVLVVAVAVVRFKFAATPVVASVVQKTNVVAEVMGTARWRHASRRRLVRAFKSGWPRCLWTRATP